ncbi:hypothetical protein HJD18_05055 [Thermoleophilia bacterium SCSIO 60948]|nr:hypothetical protein HJD18_05055 [Thermoleophilia bacterium SCSIO 60948]
MAVAAVVVIVIVVAGGGNDAKTPTAPAEGPTAQVRGPEAGSSGKGPRDGEEKPAESEQPLIELSDGQPVGGVRELSYSPGDQIRFAVASDVDDEIHFHGYDVSVPVRAGKKAQVEIDNASLEGVFEVELEDRVIPIAEVTVSP